MIYSIISETVFFDLGVSMDMNVTAQFGPQRQVRDEFSQKMEDLCSLIGEIAIQYSRACKKSNSDVGDRIRMRNTYSVLANEVDQFYEQLQRFQSTHQDRDEQTDTPPTLIE